ncbi:hypothetical protein HA466_0316150 [Hirschfeldia incana]|nr:hypothetical protein HA466_0316150 [Hirschfeldia incana]
MAGAFGGMMHPVASGASESDHHECYLGIPYISYSFASHLLPAFKYGCFIFPLYLLMYPPRGMLVCDSLSLVVCLRVIHYPTYNRYKQQTRGIAPGVTGSLATGATYFGVIDSTKKWIEESHPNLGGHWVHFLAGAIGDTLGSFVYVPCEVIKQRMQIQGTSSSWSSFVSRNSVPVKPTADIYGSTLARDVPFAGLMVMFYEVLKDLTDEGKKKFPQLGVNGSVVEGLVLGGLAGGTTKRVSHNYTGCCKNKIASPRNNDQVQGMVGCSGADMEEGRSRGGFQRKRPKGHVMWYLPASALTFMAVEFLREKGKNTNNVVSNLSIESKRSSIREVREN